MMVWKKFRKKPVVVEAFQLTETTMGGLMSLGLIREIPECSVYDHLHDTWVKCEIGDWIIRGVQGEVYPCKASVFEQTYEPVEGEK